MKIVTVTLCPATDVHASLPELRVRSENAATVISKDAGGKGVNISRALKYNGTESTALVFVGADNAAPYRQALERDGLTCIFSEKPGSIRENLTLHAKDGSETRISFSGFPLDEGVLEEIPALVKLSPGDILTFTGKVADGIPMEAVRRFLSGLRESGVRVVVDSKSFTPEDLLSVVPFLVKPNEEEISAILRTPVHSFADCADGCRSLLHGGIEYVMVSLGSRGAMLCCSAGTFLAQPPRLSAVSTIGAGDSSIAGFLQAFAEGKDPAECLRRAVAFGSAACLRAGTLPPLPQDVAALLGVIRLSSV